MKPLLDDESSTPNPGPISVASEALRQGAARMWGPSPTGTLRARVLSGSMIMLVSSGMVGAMNLVYNLAIARGLGAAGFGHASAVYTVLMLLSSVTFSCYAPSLSRPMIPFLPKSEFTGFYTAAPGWLERESVCC